jgi:hypothetical protein
VTRYMAIRDNGEPVPDFEADGFRVEYSRPDPCPTCGCWKSRQTATLIAKDADGTRRMLLVTDPGECIEVMPV